MNQRRHLTLVAAAAAVLASMPLATVFEQWTWMVNAVILVAALCGTAVLVRSLRAPAWVPTVAMVGTYILVLSWLFQSGEEFAGIIPDMSTLANFNGLLLQAAEEMRLYGVPVEDRDGFMFLATLGVGAVTILVDLCAVALRRPALAGLPMLAIYSVPVAVHTESVSMWPFVLGAAGFLWLLVSDNVDRVRRFGRRFTGDGRNVDLWEPSPLAAAGQRLGVIGVTIAVLLPLAVPGMTGGLISRFGGGGAGGQATGDSGSGTGVKLYAMLSGELKRNRTISMLKVSTTDPNPYYLRMAVAEQLTPTGFAVKNPPPGRPATQGLPEVRGVPGGAAKTFKANVEVVDLNTAFLPVYSQPTKIENLDASWLYDEPTSVIFSSRGTQKKRYSFDYTRQEYPAEALRRANDLAPTDPVRQRLTQTPRVQQVDELVTRLTAGKPRPYDRVRAILDYFSPANDFVYSVTTEPGNSGNELVDFLTNKKGYCVQYSAAMAWMVRAAGIPARVAFGFTRGAATTDGTPTTLTNFNLHAWTEVYFDGFGWVPFDATPATGVVGSVSPAWAPNPSRPTDAPAPGQDDSLDPAAPGTEESAPPSVAEPRDSGTTAAPGPVAPITQRWPIWTVLGLVLVLALLAAPAFRRMMIRRRRLSFHAPPPAPPAAARADPAQPGQPLVVVPDDPAHHVARHHAHATWEELLDTMTDYRLPVDEAETPRATADRLVSAAQLAEQAMSGARLLGQAEERARYAPRPLPPDELRPSLAMVRTALKTRASRRTRLRATLLPPSVVQRWRLAMATRSSQAFNAMAQVAESVVRTLSVRRLIAGRAGSR